MVQTIHPLYVQDISKKTYYTSFEDGSFPNEPYWSVSIQNPGWTLTSEEAATGRYSIKTPTFFNSNIANVTITVPQSWGTPGRLYYSLLAKSNFVTDSLTQFVDDQPRLSFKSFSTKWVEVEISLSPGSHTVTWSYA